MAPNPSKSGAARLPANGDVPVKPIEESLVENEPVTHNQHFQTTKKYEWQIVWRNVVAFIYLHTAFIYGLYTANSAKTQSFLFDEVDCQAKLEELVHEAEKHSEKECEEEERTFLLFIQQLEMRKVHLFRKNHTWSQKFCRWMTVSQTQPITVIQLHSPEVEDEEAMLTDLLYLDQIYPEVVLIDETTPQNSSTTVIDVGPAVFYSILGAYGITAGAHRLWSHKCYKANTALRIFLAFCNTGAFQNHIYEWSRDHRVHHKFTDTDADPHNSRRGFFFAHIGWLMLKKHPDVKRKGQLVDMSDLEQDWVVMFQRKYYLILMPICTFLIPVMIPMYCWGETLNIAFHLNLVRYTFGLNFTWLVNSAAHIWGNRPYDRSISPAENVYVSVLAFGEGWHNYHHAFPWDYKTSELSGYRTNFTTAFIDLFARFGWAYDLKTVRPDMIRKRAARTGDGTYHTIDGGPWGWDDPDITKDDKDVSEVINSIED